MKKIFILCVLFFSLMLLYSCGSENINVSDVENIKIELFYTDKNEEKQIMIIYDSTVERSVYHPYFVNSCIGLSERISLSSVPKTITKEGSYFLTLYGKENEVLGKYKFMTPKVMVNIDTGIIYKTEILQEIYVYLAKKSLNIE